MIEEIVWAVTSEMLNCALAIRKKTENRRLRLTRMVVFISVIVALSCWLLAVVYGAVIDEPRMAAIFFTGGLVSMAISFCFLVYAAILDRRLEKRITEESADGEMAASKNEVATKDERS